MHYNTSSNTICIYIYIYIYIYIAAGKYHHLCPNYYIVLCDFWVCQCQWFMWHIDIHSPFTLYHWYNWNVFVNVNGLTETWLCTLIISCTLITLCTLHVIAQVCLSMSVLSMLRSGVMWYLGLSLSMTLWHMTTLASQISGFVIVSGGTETWSCTQITLCTLMT